MTDEVVAEPTDVDAVADAPGAPDAVEAKEKKKGIIHLPRVPPFMKPAKLRHLLAQYGDVTKLYVKPEDASAHRRRVKAGGNRKEKFSEAWVEFASKKVAKRVALALNNTPIGGKKSSFYSSDLWNLKYVSKLKWSDLTAKLAYERMVKTQRLRQEMTLAKKSVEMYMSRVDEGQDLKKVEEKRVARGDAAGVAAEAHKVRRKFRQKRGVTDEDDDHVAVKPDVLAKVLGKRQRTDGGGGGGSGSAE